jgi:hypothetical protein
MPPRGPAVGQLRTRVTPYVSYSHAGWDNSSRCLTRKGEPPPPTLPPLARARSARAFGRRSGRVGLALPCRVFRG